MAADYPDMWGLNDHEESVTGAVFVNISCCSSGDKNPQAWPGWNDLQVKDDPEIPDVFGDSSFDIFLAKYGKLSKNKNRWGLQMASGSNCLTVTNMGKRKPLISNKSDISLSQFTP